MGLWWSAAGGVREAKPACPEVVAAGQRSVGPAAAVPDHVVVPAHRCQVVGGGTPGMGPFDSVQILRNLFSLEHMFGS